MVLLKLISYPAQAFEESYPALRTTDAVDVFSDVRPSHLAAQLNRLTAPGAALRLDQLSPGQVLTSADDEVLQVMEVRWGDNFRLYCNV